MSGPKREGTSVPKFLSSTPWYAEGDSASASKPPATKTGPEWYERGKPSTRTTKFKKGACANCGSTAHKERDCLERPRKKGAKHTKIGVEGESAPADIETTWDSKRDRWNGYDPEDYRKVVERYEMMEKIQEARGKTQEEAEDEEIAVRSLRDRSDTAHYLKDLSKDSTAYDPETGTYKGVKGTLNEQGQFVRELDEDALKFEKMRNQAADAAQVVEAGPTAGYLRFKQMQEEERERQEKAKSELVGKYGGAEYMVRPKEVNEKPVVAVAEKPAPAPTGKSRYDEDVYPGNHSSVWGSYWEDGKWGFACCHSFVKQSYCVGGLGKRTREDDSDSDAKRARSTS